MVPDGYISIGEALDITRRLGCDFQHDRQPHRHPHDREARYAAGEMPQSPAPRTVVGVGGIVRMPGGILLVRLTYSRHRGKFMFPGGKVDQGESLEAAVVREVREETGVDAEPDGIVAVRHRVDPDELNTYLIFEMRHIRGQPYVASPESDEVRVFSADDLQRERDLLVSLVPEVARPVLEGKYARLDVNNSYTPSPPYDDQTFQIYGSGRRTSGESDQTLRENA